MVQLLAGLKSHCDVSEGGGQALGNNHDSETSSWGRMGTLEGNGHPNRTDPAEEVRTLNTTGKAQLAPETAYAVLKTPQPKTINELFLLVMQMT